MRGASFGWALLGAILVIGPVLSACGGDDDNSSGGGGSPDDQAYVTGLCKSVSDFGGAMDAALAGPTPADFGEALGQIFTAMIKPLQDFSNSFAKLTPPSDLKDWHEKTAKQLSAAAKALKAGNFDDPALGALNESPVPNMPEKPRQRLKALAEKTKECGDLNPFEDSSSGDSFGSGEPTKELVDIAAGKSAWAGDFGSLTFNGDGTAKFELKQCGTDSSSNKPFGVLTDCDPQSYSGKVKAGHNSFSFTGGDLSGISFDAYLAKDGLLHVGVGTIGEFQGQKGTIDVFAAGLLTVDGNNCTLKDFASTKDSRKVDCSFKKEQGRDVLEFEGSFDTEKIVILPDEGLAVSPEIYVAGFKKK